MARRAGTKQEAAATSVSRSGDGEINGRIERVHLEENVLQRGRGEHAEEKRCRADAENEPDAPTATRLVS